MATFFSSKAGKKARRIEYPSRNGRPMAETDLHRELMEAVIKILMLWFAPDPRVYVSGNLLIHYVPGNRRKHVAPDVFVVFGVPKRQRDYYLLWEEGKAPAVVIEITSKSTRREDLQTKFILYRDLLKVKEYFLFDPRKEYLEPRLQGFRLVKGQYVPITLAKGRIPSKTLGLHLQADGQNLRFYDPAAGQWLLSPEEKVQRLEREVADLRRELGRRNGAGKS